MGKKKGGGGKKSKLTPEEQEAIDVSGSPIAPSRWSEKSLKRVFELRKPFWRGVEAMPSRQAMNKKYADLAIELKGTPPSLHTDVHRSHSLTLTSPTHQGSRIRNGLV
jgi:hypothetical protein